MNKLHVSPEALADLESIKCYISRDLASPQAAQKQVAGIVKRMRGLAEYPLKGAALSSILGMNTDYRYLVCGSYLVFYRCEKGSVFIVRVLYGRRDYMRILFGEIE